MKNLILIFLLLASQAALAREVLVTTNLAISHTQLLKIIKDLPAEINAESLFEKNLSTPVSAEDQEELFKEVSQAENDSLKGNFKLAIKKYESALKLLEGFANINGLHKITFTCFAKLAELYEVLNDLEKSNIFWKKAKAWDPAGELNPEIFTPKSIKKFNELKLSAKFDLELQKPPYSVIFIDGKKISNDKTNKISLFEGKHQVALLEVSGKWQIKNFNIKNNDPLTSHQMVFESVPVVEGTCDNPQLAHFELAKEARLIAVFENCKRVFDQNKWYTFDGQALTSSLATNEINNRTLFSSDTELKKSSWISDVIKSPWFWGTVGAVGIFVFVKSQEQQTVVVPTHSLY